MTSSKNKKILFIVLATLLFIAINICIWVVAKANTTQGTEALIPQPCVDDTTVLKKVNNTSNDITYHGRTIKDGVHEYTGDQLENIRLDSTCKFDPYPYGSDNESNEFGHHGDRMLGPQLDGNYDFSDSDGKYVIKNLRLDLDAAVNDRPDVNPPDLILHYNTDTWDWDWNGELFKFYWKIRYFNNDDGIWWAYNDYPTSFRDLNDQGGRKDESFMSISMDVRDNILKCCGSENMATAIRDGKVEIILTKMIADSH